MYTPAVTIVAAWISADTGVGPAIASGQPHVQRDLRRLAGRADEQKDADERCGTAGGVALANAALIVPMSSVPTAW
jgi:hypothetical protein